MHFPKEPQKEAELARQVAAIHIQVIASKLDAIPSSAQKAVMAEILKTMEKED